MKQKTLFISAALLLLLTFGAIVLYATSGDKGQTIKLTHANTNAGNTVQMSIKPVPQRENPIVAASQKRLNSQVPQANRIQQVNGTQMDVFLNDNPESSTASPVPVNPISSRIGDDALQLPPPPGRPDTLSGDDQVTASPFPTLDLPPTPGGPVDQQLLALPSSEMAVSQVSGPQEMDYDPAMQIQVAPQAPPVENLPESIPLPEDFGPLSSGSIPPQFGGGVPDMAVENIASLSSHSFQDSTNSATSQFDPTMRMGTALPGPKAIDGTQSPILILEKIMPREISVNEKVTIKINVRNNGGATAHSVTVLDRVPQGTRLESTSPQAIVTDQGDLLWNLDQLEPNKEKSCEVTVVAMQEGEIGSVATATFNVDVGSRTLVTKPALTMEVRTEESHLIGDNVVFEIALTNPGTGIAQNIILEEYVPEGLFHPKGQKLSSPVGNLNPGETKFLKMSMQAKTPGDMVNRLVAVADGGLNAEILTPIRLLAPRLDLEIDGPKMRYLERKATYQLHVGNSGSAPARDIKLMVKLPEGVDFISTDSSGVYEPGKHVVHWALEEVPPGQSGEIELVIIPRKLGNCQITFSGEGATDIRAETQHDMAVQGIAALCFELIDLNDPVEIGQNATYEIRIANQGTKASQNVKITVQLSAGMELVDVKAPVSYSDTNGNLEFAALQELAPKEEKVYAIKAKCLQMGDHRVKVQVISDDLKQPVTKEESTKVYGDE